MIKDIYLVRYGVEDLNSVEIQKLNKNTKDLFGNSGTKLLSLTRESCFKIDRKLSNTDSAQEK